MSYLHTLKLLENVNHENLKLIYDTGNPCTAYRRIVTPPYPLQSSWEFYRNVREHIVYVHIKDFTALPNDDLSTPARQRAFAGDGTGDVRAIVSGHMHEDNFTADYCGVKLCFDGAIGFRGTEADHSRCARVFEIDEARTDQIHTHLVYARDVL